MKRGDTILIIPSIALQNLQLDELVGTYAKITEVVGEYNHERGCWVELPHPYLDEYEWYIPYNSIGI